MRGQIYTPIHWYPDQKARLISDPSSTALPGREYRERRTGRLVSVSYANNALIHQRSSRAIPKNASLSASADLTNHRRPRKSRRPTERTQLFCLDLHSSHLSLASLFSLMTSNRLRAHENHISLVPMNIIFHFGVEEFQTSGKRDGRIQLPKPLSLTPASCSAKTVQLKGKASDWRHRKVLASSPNSAPMPQMMHNAPLSTFRSLALPNSGMAARAASGDRHLAALLGRQHGNDSK
jgi:hypothetical protein